MFSNRLQKGTGTALSSLCDIANAVWCGANPLRRRTLGRFAIANVAMAMAVGAGIRLYRFAKRCEVRGMYAHLNLLTEGS